MPRGPLYELDNDPRWGLFDEHGHSIEDSLYRRGMDRARVGLCTHVDRHVEFDYAHEELIYCGPAVLHYGHFILDCLARFWPIWKGNDNVKILLHSEIPAKELF